jgi:hypothetical protein
MREGFPVWLSDTEMMYHIAGKTYRVVSISWKWTYQQVAPALHKRILQQEIKARWDIGECKAYALLRTTPRWIQHKGVFFEKIPPHLWREKEERAEAYRDYLQGLMYGYNLGDSEAELSLLAIEQKTGQQVEQMISGLNSYLLGEYVTPSEEEQGRDFELDHRRI